MATLHTKFSIGDVVWHANVTTDTFQHACPDCMGAKKWEARSPAGGVFSVPCPRCNVSYKSDDELRLNYTKFVPSVRTLTIGQVRAVSGPEPKVEYMCLETGVGSGSIYYEESLFATEAEALISATLLAGARNADQTGFVAIQYNRTVEFADYQFGDAQLKAKIDAARSSQWRVGYLVEDLEQADDIDSVRDRIQQWRDRDRDEWAAMLASETSPALEASTLQSKGG